MKRVIQVGILALVLAPLGALAQEASIDALRAQLATLQAQLQQMQSAPSPACVAPAKTLSRGASSVDVTLLQQFLAKDFSIYPEGTVSGFYGALTEAAVKRFQAREGIVSSGTSAETGYGAVGPKTLAMIRKQAGCDRGASAVSGATTAQTGSIVPQPPAILFTEPRAGVSLARGGGLSVVWQTTNAPSGSSLALSLERSGTFVADIAKGLPANGSYFLNIPVPQKSGSTDCSLNPIACLLLIAEPEAACTGLCSIPEGSYQMAAKLLYGGLVLSAAKSPVFLIGGASASTPDLLSYGTSASTTSTSGTSAFSYSQLFANLLSAGTSATSSFPMMCLYAGVSYAEGITLTVNCADVTLPGQSCGSYGGMNLTCRSGQWVDSVTGATTSIPHINANTTQGGSCTTPWQSQKVQSGTQIPFEPFFTGGNYSNSGLIPVMQCTNGQWSKCDWTGDKCVPYASL